MEKGNINLDVGYDVEATPSVSNNSPDRDSQGNVKLTNAELYRRMQEKPQLVKAAQGLVFVSGDDDEMENMGEKQAPSRNVVHLHSDNLDLMREGVPPRMKTHDEIWL